MRPLGLYGIWPTLGRDCVSVLQRCPAFRVEQVSQRGNADAQPKPPRTSPGISGRHLDRSGAGTFLYGSVQNWFCNGSEIIAHFEVNQLLCKPHKLPLLSSVLKMRTYLQPFHLKFTPVLKC